MALHHEQSTMCEQQHHLIDNPVASIITLQLPPISEGCSRLFLCRHGQTDYNYQRKLQGRGVNIQLNNIGLHQAKYLAIAMKDVPLSGIYSSSLKRAFETADEVAQFHPQIKVQTFSEVEEMNFGELEGHSIETHEDEIHTMYMRWKKGELDASWPGGESPMDVVHRGVKKITEVVSNTPLKGQVLMVAHGRFNKIILAHMLHSGLTDMTEIHQDNTCVNVIDFDHKTQTYRAMVLNNINHLPLPPSV
ncbi:unnamed protein product [Peronospora belbahrii]|uniref:Phosphoglycerate mutase n=1 Tax=Peronospora belbahrii TaxID=622444 RepID=A0ABN8D027_9STRA|nr:unnamed protein product [Peronospora belbahrii]